MQGGAATHVENENEKENDNRRKQSTRSSQRCLEAGKAEGLRRCEGAHVESKQMNNTFATNCSSVDLFHRDARMILLVPSRKMHNHKQYGKRLWRNVRILILDNFQKYSI